MDNWNHNHIGREAMMRNPAKINRSRCFFKLVPLLLIFGLAGCERKLNVQVFIVTKGGENIKLGLVQVGAVPYEDAKEAIERNLSDEKKQQETLSADKTRIIAEFDGLNLEASSALATKTLSDLAMEIGYAKAEGTAYCEKIRQTRFNNDLNNPSFQTFENRFHLIDLERFANNPTFNDAECESLKEYFADDVWKGLPEVRNTFLKSLEASIKATDAKRKAEAQYDKLKNDLSDDNQAMAALSTPLHYYEGIPTPTITAKTDAEGGCTLTLPKNKNWVLVARAERTVGEQTEEYYWAVNAPTNSDKILLSNDNLLPNH